MRRRYTQWRESAVVEEVNHHLRDLEKRETSNGMSTEATLWHKTICCGVLNERSTQALTVSEWEYDSVRKDQEQEARRGFRPDAKELPREWSEIMLPAKTWISTGTDAAFIAVMAWKWLLYWGAISSGQANTLASQPLC